MDNQRDLVEIMPHSLEEVKLALQESLELVDENETNALTEDETTPTNNPTSAPSQFESEDESSESW
jgi:hypothetical protein